MTIPIHLLALLFEEKSATRAGTAIKEVTCEECGFEYVYQLRRTANGRATSFLGVGGYEKAEARAGENLRRALNESCDPVPCPACGWYQKDMVARARKLHRRGMLLAGLVLFPVSVILGVAGLVVAAVTARPGGEAPVAAVSLLIPAGVVAALALALPLLKFVLSWLYDPNAHDQDVRMQMGRARAVNRAAYVRDNAAPPAPDPPSL